MGRKAYENAIRNEEENAMKRLLTGCALVAVLWTAVGVAEAGQRGRFACGGVHAVRANPATGVSEMFLTNVALRNLNDNDPVTIERITIRDPFGEVVYDGGPAIGAPFPQNTDFQPPLDVTVVPAGGAYYLWTKNIWGDFPIPAGNQHGFALTFVVQFSTPGSSDLVTGVASTVVRQRVTDTSGAFLGEGEEHTRVRGECTPIK